MTKKGSTWTDSLGRVPVRFDLQDCWRYTADFLVALVRRYGETLRISNFGIGEYYSGSDVESARSRGSERFARLGQS